MKKNINEILKNCEGYMDRGIKVINICDLFETIWPDFFNKFNLCYEREKEFAELVRPGIGKDYHYYSECKERFSTFVAVRQAKEKNLPIVIVENMS